MNQTRLSKLLYFLLLFVLVACQAQATPPAATAIPPTAAPTVAASQALTTFSSKIYKLPMSVSFGPDWHVIDDYTDLVTVARKQEDWNVGFNIVTNTKVADPVSGAQLPFPADFASWIKSDPDFKAGEPTEVTVAGIKGLQIDATPRTTKQKDFLYNEHNKWNLIPSPEGWRFILLNDVNGERLLILLIAPADQFKVAVEQAQAVLDTISFAKPSATVSSTAAPTAAPAQALTTFSPKTFKLPMSVSFDGQWHVTDNFSDLLTLQLDRGSEKIGELGFNLVNYATIADPNSPQSIPWPDDFVAYLQSNQHLKVGQPTPVTVGGVKGVQIDALSTAIGQRQEFISNQETA